MTTDGTPKRQASDDDKADTLPDLTDFQARLQSARLAAGLDRPDPGSETQGSTSSNKDMGLGVRIAAELVAGVLFGLLLGLGLDHWLGWKPWGLIFGVLIGAIAGFMNVIRAAGGMGYAVGYKRSREDGDQQE